MLTLYLWTLAQGIPGVDEPPIIYARVLDPERNLRTSK